MIYKLIMIEELAAAGAPFGPLSGCDQTAEAIMQYGSPRLQQELLPRSKRGACGSQLFDQNEFVDHGALLAAK